MPSGLVLGLWDRLQCEERVIRVGVWEGRGNAEEEREGGKRQRDVWGCKPQPGVT